MLIRDRHDPLIRNFAATAATHIEAAHGDFHVARRKESQYISLEIEARGTQRRRFFELLEQVGRRREGPYITILEQIYDWVGLLKGVRPSDLRKWASSAINAAVPATVSAAGSTARAQSTGANIVHS